MTCSKPPPGVCRYIPESARWLLTQGRKEEARQLLQRAATTNDKLLPVDALDKVGDSNTLVPGGCLSKKKTLCYLSSFS